MSPIINFLTLTPNNVVEYPWVEVDGIETHILARAYPLAGVFLGSLGMVQISARPIVFRVIYENHRTLHENNKLLLTSNENHEGNQTLGEWWKEAVIAFYGGSMSAGGPLFQKQWIISFDVQSYKTNKVQIFVGNEYRGEEDINDRRLVSVLLDPTLEFRIFLRAVYPQRDLYFYGLRCDYIE